MDYDDILKKVGQFGRFQKIVYVIVWFTFMPTSIHICHVVFLTQEPVFRCAVPSLPNDTYHVQNLAHERLLNASIPFNADKNRYSKCKAFEQRGNGSDGVLTNQTSKCHRWVYDEDEVTNSMVPELDIPCDIKTYKVSFGLAIMIGLLAGSTFGGMASDYFGRKKCLIVCVIIHFALSVGFTFVTSLKIALGIKFLQSALGFAGHMCKFVLIVEITGPKLRGIAAMATMLAWSLAMCLIAMVYYVCQDWKTAQLVLTLPFAIFIPLTFFIPESPRWLLVHNKVPEAKKIIARIAKFNNVSLPDDIVDQLAILNLDQNQKKSSKYTMILQLFSTKTMILRLIVLGLNWGIANISYYGLTLNVGRFAGKNIYIAMLMQGAVESIAFGAVTASGGKLGRKLSYCVCMLIGGCACLLGFILGVTHSDGRWINLVLFAIGKFGVGAAFTLVYTMSTEMMPTASRNFGLGLCSLCGRLFGIIAPYIANMKLLISGRVGEVAPLAIFGVISILAGISIYLLPETQRKHLPESIRDIKKSKAIAAASEEQQEMI